MKKILVLLIILLPSLAFAQASKQDLIGLGMSAELAEALSLGVSAKGAYTVLADNDANRKFTFDATNDSNLMFLLGDGGTTATQSATIGINTPDGDDDGTLYLSGGAVGTTRGANLEVRGNDVGGANAGGALIAQGGGGGAASDIRLILGNSSASIDFENTSGSDLWTISNAGALASTSTTDIGWSIVNAANQACNTTCTSGCVFGFNTGALGNFLACTDATADSCLCAGAS